MRRYITYVVLLIIALIGGVLYGIYIQKYRAFPYKHIKSAYYLFCNPGPWSIGIYEGPTPFDLQDPKHISNPVLTAEAIDDIEARFVADPFMAHKNGEYFMFFEVLNRKTHHGDIGYAKSADGVRWEYKKIVIDEQFHLAYPYVFEYKNDYYIIPDSQEDLSVRLYKASSFPDEWQYVANLLSGYRYADPSIFRYNNKWWLFVSTHESSSLNLYYSSELLNGWKPHPMNPLVKFDPNIARPGGRVIIYNGKPHRFAQDNHLSYGAQIFAFEIINLSEESYAEKLASEKPVVNRTGKGWNAAGMHHVDLHRVGDKWIAAVDGRYK